MNHLALMPTIISLAAKGRSVIPGAKSCGAESQKCRALGHVLQFFPAPFGGCHGDASAGRHGVQHPEDIPVEVYLRKRPAAGGHIGINEEEIPGFVYRSVHELFNVLDSIHADEGSEIPLRVVGVEHEGSSFHGAKVVDDHRGVGAVLAALADQKHGTGQDADDDDDDEKFHKGKARTF